MQRVVIVGGGFGGLGVAKALANQPVAVTLLDRSNHHLFQPLLYQVALAGLSPADIAAPIRSVLRKARNLQVLMGEVAAVDRAARQVRLRDGTALDYDYLVLAPGAQSGWFGHPEWAEHAFGLKTLDDALQIRTRILLDFETAEREHDPERRRQLLTFVIIGAGPTGVELAGTLAELSKTLLARDFRRVAPTEPRVLLVEAGERVLAAFDPALSAAALRDLRELGVEVFLGTRVQAIDASSVTMNGRRVPTRTVVWAAGVAASPLLQSLGLPLDPQGRIAVNPDLSLPDAPEVFVVGDAARLEQDGAALPGLGAVALQQGPVVGANILATALGRPRKPFRYKDKGTMATIGRSRAVAQFPRLQLTGLVAWLAWLGVHLLLLVGWGNRVLVLLQWCWQYLAFRSGARLITGYGVVRGSPAALDGRAAGAVEDELAADRR
ncbi:MAG: NAD(P)/FAD-dependent oxidoreductase [Deltaproteobacteria bacterium]|nr:NAD(P)/FAD-dependent oxidoreductase [Deltaproteobacteria bacterium]